MEVVGLEVKYLKRYLHAGSSANTRKRQKKRRIILFGEVANPADIPNSGPFHPHCKYAEDVCKAEPPI